MISRILRYVIAAIIILIAGITELKAQSFDYQKYPRLSVDITQLDLDLKLNPEEHALSGTVNYLLKSRIDGLDSLVLHAAHMEIEKALVNGEPVEFRLHNDSLFVPLSDSSAKGEAFEVSIDYSSSPKFGLLKNESGTIWTSLLPKSTRHWLPTVDHPRVTLKSSLAITVPSGYEVMATGSLTGNEINDVNSITYTFETDGAVPVSALSFATGKFSTSETSYGIKNIRLSSEEGLLTTKEENQLLQKSYQVLKQAEQYLGMEFPYEQLNVAVLKDHNWEAKSWGAGTVFIYQNYGSLQAQLRRGIYAQWFGVHQRAEQWQESIAYPLLQTALHFELRDEVMLLDNTDTPQQSITDAYVNLGISSWNSWQKNYKENLNENWRETVSSGLKQIGRWEEGVYSWNDYAEYWYEQSGQPRFELPGFDKSDSTSASSDSIRYRVDYNLNEQEGRLKLRFRAQRGTINELLSLPLITVSGDSRDTSEVTFTGEQDSIIVNVPMLAETVYIDASAQPNLSLDEYKPAHFLIYEVRNGETVSGRAKAASKLGSHTDNADLQLAIRDMLNQEMEAEVKGALLQSFADITDGASGTEQVFLDAMNSSSDKVRLAALVALQNYANNEAAVSSIESFAANTSSLRDFKNATKIFSTVSDTSIFEDFVNDIVQQDTAGHKAIFAIQELANMGGIDQAVTLAQYYTSDVYDYSIRASALGILIQHDKATEDWRSRAEEFMGDTDPRIRFLTVLGLPKITGLNAADLLQDHILDEYDARVHAAMEKVIDN